MFTDPLSSVDPTTRKIIETFALTASPAYAYLVVYTLTGAIYLPFLIAIFYFSTTSQRRSPIFCFVTLGVALGIVQTAQADQFVIHGLRHPFAPIPVSQNIPGMIFNALPTYFVDIALLLRVVAVYPPRTISRLKFALIIGLPVLLKILRVVEWILWSISAAHRASSPAGKTPGPGYDLIQHRLGMARVIMTVIDNTYITVVFVWKLRSSLRFRSEISHESPERAKGNILQTRIRTLFWFAVSDFVFPVPLLIAQLILSIRNRADTFAYDILGIMVGFTCVICAVFATIWRGVDHMTPEVNSVVSTPLQFRIRETGDSYALDRRSLTKTRDASQRCYHGELELGRITFGTLQPSSQTLSNEGSMIGDADRH